MSCSFYPGIAHVVAIAHPRHHAATKFAKMLPDGKDIGQHLAGVREVGKPVDDRYAGMTRKFHHVIMRIGADHDPVHVAGEHARCVRDGFTASQLHVTRRQEVRGAAKLCGANFKRNPGARGRFHEDHGQRPACKWLFTILTASHAFCKRQQCQCFRGREVGDVQEISVRVRWIRV